MIEVSEITKYYGDFPAVTNLSFKVDQGEILGFLGPNGAGKSTTMKMLTGFMPPTDGTIQIAGFDIVEQSINARKHIGYLPETVPLYLDMTVSEYLSFMGTIRGLDSKKVALRKSEVIDQCNLGDYYSTYIGKLSKGYRQRVGISQAIFANCSDIRMGGTNIYNGESLRKPFLAYKAPKPNILSIRRLLSIILYLELFWAALIIILYLIKIIYRLQIYYEFIKYHTLKILFLLFLLFYYE